jgi:hypothetical protein
VFSEVPTNANLSMEDDNDDDHSDDEKSASEIETQNPMFNGDEEEE